MANNDKVNQAFALYKSGKALKYIADELGIKEGTIRSWKSRYKWDDEEKCCNEKCNVATLQRNSNSLVNDATKETMNNTSLTPKEQLFCVHYIKSFNAVQSYINAFDSKYNVAAVEGYRLLKKPRVKEEIDRLKEIRRQEIILSEQDMVEYHMRIAFADIGNYVKFGNSTVSLKMSDKTDTQLIQEVKSGKNGISIKLIDRNKSLEWLDRYFMFNPMDKHKMEYDQNKYALELLKLEMQLKDDGEHKTVVNDNFLDALNAIAGEVWSDE